MTTTQKSAPQFPVPGQVFEWRARISGTPYFWEIVEVPREGWISYTCTHPDGRVTGPHTDPVSVLDNATAV